MRPENKRTPNKTPKKRGIGYGLFAEIAEEKGKTRQAVRQAILHHKNKPLTELYNNKLSERENNVNHAQS